MTVFEAKRLLEIYKASQAPLATDTGTSKHSTNQPHPEKVKHDIGLGWIPNPRTEMNRFYSKVYESFYLERAGYFGDTKKSFKKAFHAEARREYDNNKMKAAIKQQMEQIKSVKDPSQAGFLLRENHVLKPHDSATIRQNLLRIENIETSLKKLEKDLKEHLETTIHSSGRILTGRKTAHDFDEDALSELQAMKRELDSVRCGLVELQQTCESAFKHTFSATKRKSRSRKQNSNKSKKRKKVRCLARMDEVLRKIAPELPEGKTCTKKDLRTEIVIQLAKRQKNWAAALISSGCSLLDDTAKSELRKILSFAGTESGDDANYDDESDGEASDAAAGDGNESDGVGSDNDAGDSAESDGDEGDYGAGDANPGDGVESDGGASKAATDSGDKSDGVQSDNDAGDSVESNGDEGDNGASDANLGDSDESDGWASEAARGDGDESD